MAIKSFKTACSIMLIAAMFYASSSAQGYYRSLDGSDGCLLDIGRTSPSTSYYDYAYTISNRCVGRYFKLNYQVNGQHFRATIAYGLDFKYNLKNSDNFKIIAVEE